MASNQYFLELEPPAERLRHAPHVVIVGGGFAGVHACKALAKADVRITLIDKRNFNLFQPLLYQVATGFDVATPLRELVGKQDNVQVLLGEVTTVNPEGKQIVFNGKAYSYDHLILATGSGSTYFGHEDWRTFAPPMKILEHAEEIRRRLLMAMEQAEQTPNPEARQFLQTVVIVGAGPSGCEMAGAVSELMRWALNPEQCLQTAGSPENTDRVGGPRRQSAESDASGALRSGPCGSRTRGDRVFAPGPRPNHAARRGGDQQPRW